MPTYVYRREDGTTFELEQRITEPAIEVCPTTGQRVQRVISGAGLIFKGSGFYLTDYARNGSAKSNGTANGSSNGQKSDSATETKSSDTKSASKTDSSS